MSWLSFLKHKNNWRPAVEIILLLAAVVLNLLLAGGVIGWLASLNLVFAALITLINLRSVGESFAFAAVAGVILDIYSGLPFGLIAVSLIFATAVMELLIANIFSNRSFYSLVGLGVIGLVAYKLIFAALIQTAFFLGFTDATIGWYFWLEALLEIITTSLFLVIVFIIIDRWTNSFRPNYLAR
jgi:rod shape-determining protein MreD